jgi:UDP-N-acetylglucosamine 2-epimerase (non-hydrolysing)
VILVAIGTRPEAIKMAPVVRALRARQIPLEIVTTGQHHDFRMMGAFMGALQDDVCHTLQRRSNGLFESFADILLDLGRLILERKPSMVLAQGDTTTVFAAALAARKTDTPFGHVEAGLRAFSRELPEEEHRIAADVFADLLFAPTRIAVENLARERVNGQVYLTGNTVLDALREVIREPVPADQRDGILVTVHRQETVDDPDKLAEVMRAFGVLARDHKVVWPVHPRTRDRARTAGLEIPPGVEAIEPVAHREFLERLSRSKLVITDSGGAQEESAILGIPCVTVRDNTERPETIEALCGILSGTSADGILAAADQIFGEWELYARPRPHLYGDGHSGERIAALCEEWLNSRAEVRNKSRFTAVAR